LHLDDVVGQPGRPPFSFKCAARDVEDIRVIEVGFFDENRALVRAVRFTRDVVALDSHPLKDVGPLGDLQGNAVGPADPG